MQLTRKEYGLTYLTMWGKATATVTGILCAGLVVGGILHLVHKSDEEYRHKCEAAGGRVVQLQTSGNVCVEKETNRLLWV